jgi:hypothetical protein
MLLARTVLAPVLKRVVEYLRQLGVSLVAARNQGVTSARRLGIRSGATG